MSILTAYANIKDGKLSLANRKRFEKDLTTFKDCAVELTIKRKNTRSSPQNRYYWGIVVKEIEIRLKQLGNDFDPDTVHEYLKDKFNQVEIIGEGGEVIDYIGESTTKMNKEQFSIYVDKIIEWANDFLNINIPLPNEKLELQL